MPFRSLPTRLAIAAAGAACVLLAGCGSDGPGTGSAGGSGAAVRLVPPSAAPAAVAHCAALTRGLPSHLGGHARRAVTPGSPLTAAWGDPPIALRCGVPLPAALTPTAQLTVVNDVSWFAQPAGSAIPSRFTEVGREAYVELTIPTRYAPDAAILVAISNAIAPAVPAKAGGRI